MNNELDILLKNEPDETKFQHAGYDCEIRRHRTMKHLCGYVLLPKSHPMAGRDYDDIDVEVHGGLTFGGWEQDSYKVGFDCAHYCDIVPGMDGPASWSDDNKSYKDLAFVTSQVQQLAGQLQQIELGHTEEETAVPA